MLIHIMRNTPAVLVMAAVLGYPQVIQAQDDVGGYIGAAFGQTQVSDFCAEEPGLTLTSCDDKDSGFKLFGGYQFNRNFALEASYFDLGETRGTGDFSGTPFNLKFDANAFTVQGVGIAPMGDYVSIFGKAGLSFWNLDVSGVAGGVPGSFSEDGVDIALGLGARFAVGRSLAIRAEWDFFPDFGDEDTGEDDLHMLSVGLVFMFR